MIAIAASFAGAAPPDLVAGGDVTPFRMAFAAQARMESARAAAAPQDSTDNAVEDERALGYAYLAGPQQGPEGAAYGGGQEYYDAVAKARREGTPEPAAPAPVGNYELVQPDDLPDEVKTDHNGDGMPDALDFDGDGDSDASVYRNRQTGEHVLVLEGADTDAARIQAGETMTGEDTPYMSAGVSLASALDAAGGLEAIVGHSYGGAVGAVAGTALGVPTYTFGAPPVGEDALEHDANGDGVFDPAAGEYSITREQTGGLVEAYELDGDVIPDLSDGPVSLPDGLDGAVIRAVVPDWLEDFADAEPLGEVHHVGNPDFAPELGAAAQEAFGSLGALFQDLLIDPQGGADRLAQSVAEVFEVAGEAHSMEEMIEGLEDQEQAPPAAILTAAQLDRLFRERLAP